MTEPSNLTPEPGLYGSEENAPQPAALGLGEMLSGIFTEPTTLFDRLRQRPTWGWAFALTMVAAILLTIVWSLRVDADALLRPILEADGRVPADQVDSIIAMQGKMMVVFGPIQALIMVSLLSAVIALVFWLVGKGFAEEGKPGFKLGWAAAVVTGLVTLPQTFCMVVMCLLKEVGGRTPEKMAPTGLGFFITVDNVKLQALLHALDPFTFAYFFLLFLAGRRMLRLSSKGASLAVGILVFLLIGMRVLAAK